MVETIKVAVVGAGVVGSKVREAAVKNGWEVVGVVKATPNLESKKIIDKGYRLFAADEKSMGAMKRAGLDVSGELKDLLREEINLVYDCARDGIGETNKPLYEKAGVKAILQGGERLGVTQKMLFAEYNGTEAVLFQISQVPSCNESTIIQYSAPLDRQIGIENVTVCIIRRWSDDEEKLKGVNDVISDPASKHARRVQAVMKDLKIHTSTGKVPESIMHMQMVHVTLRKETSADSILKIWNSSTKRIITNETLNSATALKGKARKIGRQDGDIWETIVQGLYVDGRDAWFNAWTDQRARVVTNNIDIGRIAVTGVDVQKSIDLTNASLGIGKW